MGSLDRTCSAKLALCFFALSAGAAYSGQAYSDAYRYLRQGDAKGLPLMEQVCKAEPFASNAFYYLAMGYLKIEKSPVKAVDAAVRGLEGYSEKWRWGVPKKALYGILRSAAKKTKAADVDSYIPRVVKLVKRDGNLAKDCVAALRSRGRN